MNETVGLHDEEQVELVAALLLEKGESVEMRLRGGSMRPWIFSGDLTRIEPLQRTPQPGMVVLLRLKGRLLAHRVLRVNRSGWVRTRGDSRIIADPWRPPHEILGEVVRVYHRSGLVLDVRRWPARRIAIICSPLFRLGFAALDLARRLRRNSA